MRRHLTTSPRPFLKWAGGKTQLLDQYARLYPPAHRVGRYLEPFVGSGAVFFHVRETLRPDRAFLADGSHELVGTYLAVRDQVEEVIDLLARHKAAHGHRHYYKVRAMDPASMSEAARAARLIYLNRTCFNGLYRVNSKGQFNVPMGRYEDPPILDAANLRAVGAALHGTSIRAAPYTEILRHARRGDFVYFDPPYHPVSVTAAFTSYTRGSFKRQDQEVLAEVYARLARRGCLVMLSNSDCDFVRRLYRAFDIRIVAARRAINSRADRRGSVSEIVALNYEPGVSPGTQLKLFQSAGPSSARPARRARRAAPLPLP